MKKTIILLLICASYLLCTTTATVNAQTRTSTGSSSSYSGRSGSSSSSNNTGSSETHSSVSGHSGASSSSGRSEHHESSSSSGASSSYSGRSGHSGASSSSESNTSTATKHNQFSQDVNVLLETNKSGSDIYAKVTPTYEQHDDGTQEIVGLHFNNPQDWYVYNYNLLNNNQDLEVTYRKSTTDQYVHVIIYAYNASSNNIPYTVRDTKPRQIKQDVNFLLETDEHGNDIYAKATVTYEQQ